MSCIASRFSMEEENQIADVCHSRADLPMEVCDAEWQWDRRKLTFYYTSDARVDFRELVRELFRVYKTRVWMCVILPLSSSSFCIR